MKLLICAGGTYDSWLLMLCNLIFSDQKQSKPLIIYGGFKLWFMFPYRKKKNPKKIRLKALTSTYEKNTEKLLIQSRIQLTCHLNFLFI